MINAHEMLMRRMQRNIQAKLNNVDNVDEQYMSLDAGS